MKSWATPAWFRAATVSPPPATEISFFALVRSAACFAATMVPRSNGVISNAPSGPFHTSVAASSIAAWIRAIDDAATLVWNGPLGAFEMTPFDRGTMVAAKHAAERTKAKKLVSVAGGGDTVAALNQAGVAGDFSYVSTAGGAFLEWLEGRKLPGVEALRVR